MEDLEPSGSGLERDRGNTQKAQKARSKIICKYHGMGIEGSQISLESKGRSFNCSAIEI